MPEFNLDSIKSEIEERRNKAGIVEQATHGRTGGPKDTKKFLSDLVNAYQNGITTESVQRLRTVTETSDQKYGVPTTVGRPAGQAQSYQPASQFNQPPAMLNENFPINNADRRGDDTFFEQQMNRGIDLLRSRAPQVQGGGLSQALTEYAGAPTGQPMVGGAINANALNEHIQKTMGDMMGNANFVNLVEGAYKNMINEMYTKEKIETALVEIVQGETFKKIIRKHIVDTLLEIQNRNKK